MTDVEFFSPSDVPDHDPSKVRRSKSGRPYVKQPCPNATRHCLICGDTIDYQGRCDCAFSACNQGCVCGCVNGRVVGKTDKGKQCPKCKGKGWIEKLYHRCTSFVSVLDDRSSLEAWKIRIVLTGLGVDHALLAALDRADPDDIGTLNLIAEQAFDVGDGHAKAQKGTDLHTLTEYVDKGWDLPQALRDPETGQERPVTLQDRADLRAWWEVKEELNIAILASECFVVNDDYEIGGTYDRRIVGPRLLSRICSCGEPMILDLKTGRLDYGAGKIAQQMAVYANSKDYDPLTGERSDQDVCTHYGIVVHLPQGTGEASVYIVDLVAGWEAVKLSSQVREHRRMSKKMLWPLETHAELTS